MNRSLRSALLATLLGGSALASGCMAQPLPGDDGFTQRFAGSWRITRADDAQIFSDYVLSADGKLTHLRPVIAGQTVEPSLGAGVVVSDGNMACVFGSSWRAASSSVLVFDGACADQSERDIALSFTDAENLRAGPKAVHTADDMMDWMRPTAWSFEKCDARACQ